MQTINEMQTPLNLYCVLNKQESHFDSNNYSSGASQGVSQLMEEQTRDAPLIILNVMVVLLWLWTKAYLSLLPALAYKAGPFTLLRTLTSLYGPVVQSTQFQHQMSRLLRFNIHFIQLATSIKEIPHTEAVKGRHLLAKCVLATEFGELHHSF